MRFHDLHSRWLLAVIAVSVTAAATAQTRKLGVDRDQLERVEDASESLANWLLSLSVAVRGRDSSELQTFFPAAATQIDATPFPTEPSDARPSIKWLDERHWPVDDSHETLPGARLLQSVEDFLTRFESVEDVRFKVKQAEFDFSERTRGSARVFFYLVGRDVDGKREWVRAWIDVRASSTGDGQWEIERFRFTSFDSMRSRVELFSDITASSNLWERVPRFGEPPNDGFVAHGVAVADVNDDGRLDFLTTGVLANRLYLNQGDGRGFRDVSEESLVQYSKIGTGALFVDYDNDGDEDVFIAAVGEQILLQNQLRPTGELVFIDVSSEAGVDHTTVGFSVTAADVNGDGYTDVYVTGYNRYGLIMPDSWSRARNGRPNLLFMNQGDGRFLEQSTEWGVRDERWSYAGAFADVDRDGHIDLYVANDFGENALFMNRGEHFVDEADARGVLDPGNGMGVSFGDFDNDGDLDLHVTNMSSTAGNRILARLMPDASADDAILKKLAAGNSLFENEGDGTFINVAARAGGLGAGWAYGGGFFDFDNDGWEDAFTVNGFVSGKTMNDT